MVKTTMPTPDLRQELTAALASFASRPLAESATALLRTLGYSSDRTLSLGDHSAQTFLATFDSGKKLNPNQSLHEDWRSVHVLFQLTDDDIRDVGQGLLVFDGQGRLDNTIIESYLFLAIELRTPPERGGDRQGRAYTRSELAQITRAVNRLFAMPVMVFFKHGYFLTFGVIDRRLNKIDTSRDVLEKITLIKDIDLVTPHRAHVEILHDLSLAELHRRHGFTNFPELHQAWRKTLDSSELNKRFFQELSNWYFWALEHAVFPKDAPKDDGQDAVSVIRLITRLIFAWFLKEKGELVPDALFDEREMKKLLGKDSLTGQDTFYYKAILQNLFFATLNQEADKREFRRDNQNFMAHNLYRYRRMFPVPERAVALFEQIPFLNGGLFECLDRVEEDEKGHRKYTRIDGFSDRDDNPLVVPDFLFFGQEQDADLNVAYGTKNKRYKTRGIISIFNRYKFTVAENTPLEEEVALDPELLGRVFENLLAAYNPDTGKTARKLTGSFYTPREIVDYMVEEALKAFFATKLASANGAAPSALTAKLDQLFSCAEASNPFSPAETDFLISVIDDLKILDPACGSGAFPMGILHKLVHLLRKLDPHNLKWKERQLVKAAEILDVDARDKALAAIEESFSENELDYGRKLYLIENCIYGVDLQPIAVQIAKLRFFISLIVDQKVAKTTVAGAASPSGLMASWAGSPGAKEKPGLAAPATPWNKGIRPLPNLETKIIAANSLLPVDRRVRQVGDLFSDDFDFLRRVNRIRDELVRIRHAHFLAKTPTTKAKYRDLDQARRQEVSTLLRQHKTPAPLARLLASWDPYDQNAHADFFDAEWMFNVRDGFDITIGNPPYVRADSGSNHLDFRRLLESSGQYETLWEKWDLFVPFIELGYKLLRPGGITTMIVSDAFCHAKYAQKPQNWFLKHSRILRLDFLSELQVFDAAVHNLVYFFQKAPGTNHCPARRCHRGEFGNVTRLPTEPQSQLTNRVFFPDDTVKQEYTHPVVTLETICYISKGMVVHANEKEHQGAFELSDLVADQQDATHPKPFVEGKHLGRWLPTEHKWLEWGTTRAPSMFSRPTFPELYAVPEKIISVDMSAGTINLRVVYDSQQLCHNHSAWSFVPWHLLSGVRNRSLEKAARYADEKPRPDLPHREELEASSQRFPVKYLLAVMNSAVARDFLRAHRRSNIHLYPEDWKALPIPVATAAQQAPIIALVEQILTLKRADASADLTELEAALDAHVARLYGLNEAALATLLTGKGISESHRLAAIATFRDLARESAT